VVLCVTNAFEKLHRVTPSSTEFHGEISKYLLIEKNWKNIKNIIPSFSSISRVLFFLPALMLFSSFPLLGQKDSKTVAEIGKEKISSDEFKIRYELMPHPSLLGRIEPTDSIKYKFLISLIAEKLWAQESENLRLDTTDLFINSIKPLEKLLVKDALYKQEVESKIKISNEELIKGDIKSRTKLLVSIINSKDSSEIFNIYSQLQSGASFDSMFQAAGEQWTTTTQINFGDLEEEAIEDSIYKLKIGQYSKPIKNESGWFIFFLKEKTTSDKNKLRNPVKEIIHERKAKEIGTPFLKKLLTGTKIEIDKKLFSSLVNIFVDVLTQKGNDKVNDKIYLSEIEMRKIMNSFSEDSLNAPFALFPKDPLTLKEFLYSLIAEGFSVWNTDSKSVAQKLNSSAMSFIENEFLYRESVKRGLQKLPEVKKELKIWRENYLAQMLRNKFYDSISINDQEAYNYFSQMNNDTSSITQVNILEILTKNLDVIQLILDELKAGKDFRELAKTYTEREWTKDMGGEFGLFPVTMYGEIGKAAENLKIGDVYGPINTSDGYSIIKLIDKKENKPAPKTFDEVKDQVKNILRANKLNKAFNDYSVKLAGKYGLKINLAVLNSIKVTNINMFTYRFIGFGGRIAAIPYTTPSYEWIEMWKEKKSLFP